MTIEKRTWRGVFLALALLMSAGTLAACDDTGGAGDTAAPPPTQN